jgi:hypothetical protein
MIAIVRGTRRRPSQPGMAAHGEIRTVQLHRRAGVGDRLVLRPHRGDGEQPTRGRVVLVGENSDTTPGGAALVKIGCPSAAATSRVMSSMATRSACDQSVPPVRNACDGRVAPPDRRYEVDEVGEVVALHRLR